LDEQISELVEDMFQHVEPLKIGDQARRVALGYAPVNGGRGVKISGLKSGRMGVDPVACLRSLAARAFNWDPVGDGQLVSFRLADNAQNLIYTLARTRFAQVW
jgi:hypothetical protein